MTARSLYISEHAQEADGGRRALVLIMIILGNNILAFLLLLNSSSFLSLLQAEVFRACNKNAFPEPAVSSFPHPIEAAAAGSN